MCCICSESISPSEEERSVALTGLNMRDWARAIPNPRNQMFWVHFNCLSRTWQGAYPWEASALIEPAD